MGNFVTYLIIILFLIPFAPFLMWHFRYIALDEKLIGIITTKYPKLWTLMNENKFAHTLVNYLSFNFNRSNFLIFTGTLIHVSFYAVGPLAQLRALKFIKSQNVTDQELIGLTGVMEKTMQKAVLLVTIYISLIILAFVTSLIYIYTH